MNTPIQKLALFGVFLLLTLAGTHADVPPGQEAEVEHLTAYLENSGCNMVRNGKTYSGEEGGKHVRRKYEYFRDDISSTEAFIELSATKSTMSGKPYKVQCPGEPPRDSADWLLEELSAYRATQP